jgi:hypothetical protein
VQDYRISFDNSQVIYLADQETDDVNELFIANSEADETVIISLSNPQNAILGAPGVFTLTIQANDGGSQAPDFPTYLPVVLQE